MKFQIISCGVDCERFVNEWYDSLKKQSCDWSALVMDDGSKDTTGPTLARISRDDPRVRYFRSEKNQGAAWARWELLQKAEPGTIIAQLDLDDYLRKDALEKVLPHYEAGKLMTLGGWQRHKQLGDSSLRFYTREQINTNTFLSDKFFRCPPLRTFHSDLIQVLRKDHFLLDGKFVRTCTDVALFFPLLKHLKHEDIGEIRDQIYFYRKRRHSKSSSRFPKGPIFTKLKEKHA